MCDLKIETLGTFGYIRYLLLFSTFHSFSDCLRCVHVCVFVDTATRFILQIFTSGM